MEKREHNKIKSLTDKIVSDVIEKYHWTNNETPETMLEDVKKILPLVLEWISIDKIKEIKKHLDSVCEDIERKYWVIQAIRNFAISEIDSKLWDEAGKIKEKTLSALNELYFEWVFPNLPFDIEIKVRDAIHWYLKQRDKSCEIAETIK